MGNGRAANRLVGKQFIPLNNNIGTDTEETVRPKLFNPKLPHTIATIKLQHLNLEGWVRKQTYLQNLNSSNPTCLLSYEPLTTILECVSKYILLCMDTPKTGGNSEKWQTHLEWLAHKPFIVHGIFNGILALLFFLQSTCFHYLQRHPTTSWQWQQKGLAIASSVLKERDAVAL